MLPNIHTVERAFKAVAKHHSPMSEEWGRAWTTLFIVYNEYNFGKELDIRNVYCYPLVYKFIKKYLEFKHLHPPSDIRTNHHNIHHDE